MSRGRFILLYTTPGDPDPDTQSKYASDSLIDLAATACRAVKYQGDEARALRVERGGSTVLDGATLTEIARRALRRERKALAKNPAATEVSLRDLVSRVMLDMGLIDERGEPVAPGVGGPE